MGGNVRSGQVYTKTQVNNLLENNREEGLCYDMLGETCWTKFMIFDTFRDSTKRISPDPYVNEAVITSNYRLIDGGAVSTTYGFTSITYLNIKGSDLELIVLDAEYILDTGGNIKIMVSVDNGSNYEVILDTLSAVDKLKEEIDVSGYNDDNVIVKIEIITDSSGNGGYLKYFCLLIS